MADTVAMTNNVRGNEAFLPHFSPANSATNNPETIQPVAQKGESGSGKDVLQDRKSMAEKYMVQDRQAMTEQVESVNKALVSRSLNVKFEVDETVTGNVRLIMTNSSDEVIREIPPKKMVTVLSKMKDLEEGTTDEESLTGLLIERKV